MFMVDGKLGRIRELADGRIAYWRGPDVPAAVLTSSQLEEVQRLVAMRLLLPFGFLMFGAGLAFLSFKGEFPVVIPVLFGAVAMLICVVVDIRTRHRIQEILRRAPAEDRLPPHITVSSRLKAAWHGLGNRELLFATWLTGVWAFSSAFGLLSKITGMGDFDPSGEFHLLTLLIAAVVMLFLFRLCLKERRRRLIQATRSNGDSFPPLQPPTA